MRDRLPLLAGFALLGLAIGLGAVVLAGGIRDRNENDTISVTGSAKARIVSDYVIWNASIASQAQTPQAALKQLNGWAAQVRSFLSAAGAQPAELTVNPVATETVTQDSEGQDTGRVLAYRLSRSFEVRSSRVAAITRLVESSQKLLAQGVPLQAQSPQYVYTRLADLRPQLLAEATKDALGRAKVLVEAPGGKLGGLRNVDVGVFQVTAPNSTDVSDYGVYDTTTLRKDVTAVVNVSFALS
ncbi:MAG TPA: SIMPL domain-containing protein [Gaiellaceae bacterium]|nr:SIMPL domain-containing protein [Gaiellaceae bacterium]